MWQRLRAPVLLGPGRRQAGPAIRLDFLTVGRSGR